MSGYGGLLVMLGAGSFVLHMLGMEFRLLMWVDLWGAGVGNVIRAAMIMIGLAMLVMGGGRQEHR